MFETSSILHTIAKKIKENHSLSNEARMPTDHKDNNQAQQGKVHNKQDKQSTESTQPISR